MEDPFAGLTSLFESIAEKRKTRLTDVISSRKERREEEAKKNTRRESRSEAIEFIRSLEESGIPIGQIGGVSPEGQVTLRQPPSPLEALFLKQALDQLGVGGRPEEPQPSPDSFQPMEETLEPTKLIPGQALIETGGRALQRGARIRETQRALTQTYQAKTAQAATGFGDSANIAIKEREFMQSSFPQDGDTYESRKIKENSLLGDDGFFNSKEAELVEKANQPVFQVLAGYSKTGPRYHADPVAIAAKKQANKDLTKLRATRIMYSQMYDEARKLMPPIGSRPKQKTEGGIPEVGQTFQGQRVKKVTRIE